MTLTASHLRTDIYRVLDRALQTGEVVTVVRKGKTLRIVPETAQGKLTRLRRRRCFKGDPEKLVHLDWSREWKP